jgi:hypothetical protein
VEERCRVRQENAVQGLAALGTTGVRLLQGLEAHRKTVATRRQAAHPQEALVLLFHCSLPGNSPVPIPSLR